MLALLMALAVTLSFACGEEPPDAAPMTKVSEGQVRPFEDLLVKAWTGTAKPHSAVVAVETKIGVICTWAYGPTIDYGTATTHTDENMATPHTIHEVAFTNLDPDTLYHYRFIAVAPDGTIYQSPDATFRTPGG